MKLNRRFYDSSINFNKISVERIVLGVVIGLASAFTIYGFFYIVRESFRVMTFGLANFPNIITEVDRNYYNLFFAGLSVIFANSITVNLLLGMSSNTVSRRNPIRRRIINDQVFLNFNFTYWLTKMALCLFVFSWCCMDFDFSAYVGQLSILLLLVLYLESWKGLSMIFRKNRFKFQFLHLIIIALLTLGLSRIDFINYKAIDEVAIKSSPKYDLPHSDFYSDISYRSYREINFKVQLYNNELKLTVFNKWAVIDEIPAIIYAERASIREEMVPFLTVRISANRDLQLKYIKMIEAKLYAVNQYNIIYDIYNDDLLTSRFESRGIKKRIMNPVYDIEVKRDYPIPPEPPINSKDYFFKDTLLISINEQIKVNDLMISKEDLVKKFKNNINRETIFMYRINSNTNYQDYITVLSSHYRAIHELRENERTVFKENEYSEQYRKEQYWLKSKYPILIDEVLN